MSFNTGLRQFYNFMSSVIYYLIIGAFLATLCVYDIFLLHEHILHISFPILFLFHANYIWHFIDLYKNTYICTCPYHRHLLIQCDAYIITNHSCILVPL